MRQLQSIVIVLVAVQAVPSLADRHSEFVKPPGTAILTPIAMWGMHPPSDDTRQGLFPLPCVSGMMEHRGWASRVLSREPGMAIYLVPDQGDGDRIAIDKAVVFIGRHPACDAVLNNSSKVSRKHCCIALVNDRLVVRDLASMNGVRVNGRHIENEATIQVGDEISFGDMRYKLQENPAPPKSGGRARSEKRQRVDLSREFPVAIPEDSDEFDESSDPEIYDVANPT